MSSEIAELQATVDSFRVQLEQIQLGLQSDPDNAELLELDTEIKILIDETEKDLAKLRPVPALEPNEPTPPVEKPKWSIENHPAYQAGYRKPDAPTPPPAEEAKRVVYKVNDMVLAKWVTGDKAFYPARITSITGSSANPVYYVAFKNYGTTETVRSGEIKPILNESKKRKADGNPAPPTTTATPPTGVISAAASIDPSLASAAKKEPSKVTDGPARPAKIPKKIKAKKELEAGKSKWKDFAAKGKFGKAAKKESMFRTGESVTARVGFTGSGQAMRKDPSRSRHVYQPTEEDND